MISKAEVETVKRGLSPIRLASVAALIWCATPALAETLDVGGVTRTFTAQLPDTQPAPLVIVLHGNTQTGADMADRTSWPQVAKREHFGVVFPDGLNRAWADLRPSHKRGGRLPPDGTDDAAFIVKLAEEFVADGVADPKRLYASQSSGWFGQVLQRSNDGGKTWEAAGNDFQYEGTTGTHTWYDGSPHPWEFKRVWHIEPSLSDPEMIYAGVEDAALFASRDGGSTWAEMPGLRTHETAPSWAPGAGGLCLHTIVIDPTNPDRVFIAISAAGVFRSEDAGKSWQPANRGLRSNTMPDEDAEVGHCVHRIAIHPSRPNTLFMQKHWDVMRSDDGAESWREISGNLPTDFGFVIDVNSNEPDTVYVVPITSDSHHFVSEGKLRVYRSKTGGDDWEALTKGLPQKDCYVNVLRDAMTVDQLDPCGVYFGTSGGQVYASADGGDSWDAIVRDLPPVLSVEVQTLK